MNKRFYLLIITIICSSLFFDFVFAASDLKEEMDQKIKELQQINDQIQETQKNLSEIQGKRKGLKQELTKIDYSIKQLNLGVRSNQLNIEKLSLEIDTLRHNIDETEQKIDIKKEAIKQVLRTFQYKFLESALITILRNKSLAESVAESQSLSEFNNNLAIELSSLKELKEELAGRLDMISEKKKAKETEGINLKNRKVIVADQKREREDLLAITQNQEKAYQEYMEELEKRQAEISAEIEKIEAELRAKIDPTSLPVSRPGVLAWPVSGSISQGYGDTAFAKTSGFYKGKWHNGIDVAVPIGTPILAAEKGKIAAVGNTDDYCSYCYYRRGRKYCKGGAYGKFVVIEHENNLTTLYAHLSRYIVPKGDIINRGDVIGYVGNTGLSTGSHLHFTVYSSATFGMRPSKTCGPLPSGGDLDPMKYL